MKTLSFLCLLLMSTTAFPAMPTCSAASGGYCQYTGKVSKIYINSGNRILIYFDMPMPIENANLASFTISNGSAGILSVTDTPDFGKLFYSTALAAQSSNRSITIQMRGTLSGYLKIDRIWLAE